MSSAVPVTVFEKLHGRRTVAVPAPSLPETTVKLIHSRDAMQLVVTQGSRLNGPTIFAWVEAIRPFPLAIPRKPILTLEAPVVDCCIRRDGFGGVSAHIGAANFVIEEGDARALEMLHGFMSLDADD